MFKTIRTNMVEKGLKIFFSKLMSTQCSSAFSRKSLPTQRFRTVNDKFYQSTNRCRVFFWDLRKDEFKLCVDIISENILFKFAGGVWICLNCLEISNKH